MYTIPAIQSHVRWAVDSCAGLWRHLHTHAASLAATALRLNDDVALACHMVEAVGDDARMSGVLARCAAAMARRACRAGPIPPQLVLHITGLVARAAQAQEVARSGNAENHNNSSDGVRGVSSDGCTTALAAAGGAVAPGGQQGRLLESSSSLGSAGGSGISGASTGQATAAHSGLIEASASLTQPLQAAAASAGAARSERGAELVSAELGAAAGVANMHLHDPQQQAGQSEPSSSSAATVAAAGSVAMAQGPALPVVPVAVVPVAAAPVAAAAGAPAQALGVEAGTDAAAPSLTQSRQQQQQADLLLMYGPIQAEQKRHLLAAQSYAMRCKR